jgi:hypothetical protein
MMALFIRLIIRIFQLVFSVGTVFFSHNKSANNVFQLAYQRSRTGPMWLHVASCLSFNCLWLQCSCQSSGVNIIIVSGSISCFICYSCLERVYCFGALLNIVDLGHCRKTMWKARTWADWIVVMTFTPHASNSGWL